MMANSSGKFDKRNWLRIILSDSKNNESTKPINKTLKTTTRNFSNT